MLRKNHHPESLTPARDFSMVPGKPCPPRQPRGVASPPTESFSIVENYSSKTAATRCTDMRSFTPRMSLVGHHGSVAVKITMGFCCRKLSQGFRNLPVILLSQRRGPDERLQMGGPGRPPRALRSQRRLCASRIPLVKNESFCMRNPGGTTSTQSTRWLLRERSACSPGVDEEVQSQKE